MKASEILAQYTAGERNFQGVNLRGQSFLGEDISGADFSEANIQGTNFTNTNLENCKFCRVKAGQSRIYKFILIIAVWIVSVLPAFSCYWTGEIAVKLFNVPNLENIFTGISYFAIITIFLITTLRKGIVFGIAVSVVSGATVGLFSMIGLRLIGKASTISATGFIIGILIILWAIESSIVSAVSGYKTTIITAILAIIMSSIFTIAGVRSLGLTANLISTMIFAIVMTGFFTGSGIYIGWLGFAENGRYDWLRPIGLRFASLGSTSFCQSNLTDANFAGALLENTDFSNALLTRTCWRNIKNLENIRSANTYLNNLQVRQWLIGKGVDKNFNAQKLQGINLQGADLSNASFIDTNLNEANLQDADLSNAKLIQTQLDRTDFTGATLTGACIEDWGITSHTKLRDVKCKYIFMRSPTDDNPNPRRKPDNWEEEFEGSDFADFIQPIFDTLDLYHNQGVDPRAIAISWKKLAENNPDAQLRFSSMEVKGENNLLLRLKADPKADLSSLSGEYFTTYNQIKALTEQEFNQKFKLLIAEKDDRIEQLETFVDTALKQPKYYYEQSGNFGVGHANNSKIEDNAKVSGIMNDKDISKEE